MSTSTPVPSADDAPRDTYRHGDLRRALIETGLALARDGGPQAVTLREVTRRAGVVPNAAYRHFANRDALLDAVRAAALATAARAMERELAELPRDGADLAAAARARLYAIGIGYLRFARDGTGLFRTAFGPGSFQSAASCEDRTGASGLDPFQLLGTALDMMVEAGLLPAARRPGAEFLAWSAVHGLAMLIIDGPLAALPNATEEIGPRLIAMVDKGL